MRQLLVWCACLLLSTSVAWGEDFVCGVAPQLTRYIESLDPTRVGDATCDQVPDGMTEAQRALIATHPWYHLKKDAGLVAVLTMAEQQAVDQARQATRDALQVFKDELTQGMCGAMTFEALEQFFGGRAEAQDTIIRHTQSELTLQIAALASADLATLQDGLQKVAGSLFALLKVARQEETGLATRLARCLLAVRKVKP